MKANQAKEFEKNDYGVFLNADASSLERFKMYETIVIDARILQKGILIAPSKWNSRIYISKYWVD